MKFMRALTYLVVFISLTATCLFSCKKGDRDVTPAPGAVTEPSYFAGYAFQPKELDDDQTRVLVSLCNVAEPTDTELGIYEYDPDVNQDDVLADLVTTQYDDDGEPIERESPDSYVAIQAKYTTPEGVKLSDFNQKKQFVLDVTRGALTIITCEDADGKLSYAMVNTTSAVATPAEVCLKR